MPHPLSGTGVALITPFSKKGSIDFESLRKLLAYVTENGVDYLVVMGTTGETATMSHEERTSVLSFIKKENKGILPIVYGHGGNNTARLIQELNDLDLNGVDGILSVSPYYNKPSQEGIFRHYSALADASPVPVILYNVPGRTASNVSADTTCRLAEHPNIIGTKEASGSLEQAMNIRQNTPEDFLLISGDDMMTLPMYSIGGNGVISVLANAFPSAFASMKNQWMEGDTAGASQVANSLTEINPMMYEEANPVGLKALLHYMGLCERTVRLPLAEASDALTQRIHKALDSFREGSSGVTS